MPVINTLRTNLLFVNMKTMLARLTFADKAEATRKIDEPLLGLRSRTNGPGRCCGERTIRMRRYRSIGLERPGAPGQPSQAKSDQSEHHDGEPQYTICFPSHLRSH